MPPLPSFVKSATPIENHDGILVKRDDLCCDSPALAKVRGLFEFVKRQSSFEAFGILDGRHSRNGWALARVCKHFGKKAVVYWPQRVTEGEANQGPTRDAANRLGAIAVGIPAGRSAVVYSLAKKDLAERYPNSVMIPNAVRIAESVDAHIREVATQREAIKSYGVRTLVMSAGSGTMAGGILSGLFRIGLTPEAFIVLGYSQNEERFRKYLAQFSSYPQEKITVIDGGYAYGSEEELDAGFPCCSYYEAKAWKWLLENRYALDEKILFWNSGS